MPETEYESDKNGIPSTGSVGETKGHALQRRSSRHAALVGIAGASAAAMISAHAQTPVTFPASSPDTITFDTIGHIWISTDGLPNTIAGYDGLFATPTEGSKCGDLRQFLSTVEGAECSGPVFNPDGTALFVSVQHPGEGGVYGEQKSTWPDFDPLPKPSVVLITRDDVGVIGQ